MRKGCDVSRRREEDAKHSECTNTQLETCTYLGLSGTELFSHGLQAPVSLAGSLEEYIKDPNFEQNRLEYKSNREIAEGKQPSKRT